MLYEMLAGRVPFPGDHHQAVIYSILNTEPEPITNLRSGLPLQLSACVESCLRKNPDQRPRDAGELLKELFVPKGPAGISGRWLPAQRRRWPRILLASSVALAVVLTIFLGRNYLGGNKLESTWLIVAEMEDLTTEGSLAPALHEALVIGLQQSPHIKTYTGQRLILGLERMGRTGGEPLTLDIACELALREGVPVVLATSIAETGSGFQLVGRLVKPSTKESINTELIQVADQQSLVEALDELSRKIRQRLGESAESISHTSENLAQVTTNSLEALRFYTMSTRAKSGSSSRALLKKAIASDSTFAMAHARLAKNYLYSANTKPALDHSKIAFDLRQKLPARERIFVEVEYYRFRSQYDLAIESLIALLELYPDDIECRMNLIHTYIFVQQYHNALEQFERIVQIAPEGWSDHHTHGLILGGLDDFTGAIKQFRSRIRKAEGPALGTRMCLSWAMICNEQYNDARAQMDTMLALDSDSAIGADYLIGKSLPALGRFSETRVHLHAARGRALSVSDTNQVAWTCIYTGLCLAAVRDHRGAARAYREAVDYWPGYFPYYLLGAELAASGDVDSAYETEREFQELCNIDPSIVNRVALAKLRGAIAFHQGYFQEAVGLLSDCPLELDARLMLGRAYLELGDYASARSQFEFLIGNQFSAFHEGLAAIWPLAYYYLGILEQEAQEPDAAIGLLNRFLEQWSEGDEGLVEVADSRRRLEQLGADLK